MKIYRYCTIFIAGLLTVVILCFGTAMSAGLAEAADSEDDADFFVNGQRYADRETYLLSEAFRKSGGRCGFDRRRGSHERIPDSGKHASDCPAEWSTNLYEYTTDTIFTIPVWVNIIRRLDGVTGEVSDALVQSQIDVLNEDFRAISGTPGQNGFDTGIQFRLAGISRYNDDCAFSDTSNECMKGMQKDPNRYLNIYTKSISDALGYAFSPQTDAGEYYDGVYIDYRYFGRNAPDGYQYNQGRSCTHEVGHYLGLLHPFEGGDCPSCVKPYCYENADLICDTNAQDEARYGCLDSSEEPNDSCEGCCLDNGGVVCVNGVAECSDGTALPDTCQACTCLVVYDPPPESCDTPDPYKNYMNFTDDTCMDNFTEEQSQRMRCSLIYYRSTLAETPSVVPSDGRTTVYRFYSEQLLTHFYTIDENEKNSIIAAFPENVWRHEGGVWRVYANPQEGCVPLYRFYSEALKRHLFTIDENEKNTIIATFSSDIWRYEGIAWYVNPQQRDGSRPIYRFYSEQMKTHFYTFSETEKNSIISRFTEDIWQYEGIAYYAY
ncbi:M43 family zinc metalloprotease [Desulfococcaceae bacterium HSG9]|nr:M43 family zinc metalloprotease [Desulfococcaceae bacterium HSG9]